MELQSHVITILKGMEILEGTYHSVKIFPNDLISKENLKFIKGI